MPIESPSVSVVIPCFNSQRYIAATLLELEKSVSSIRLANLEIITIIDGPNHELVRALQDIPKMTQLRIIELDKNYGQHYATYFGCLLAKYQYVITMDDDGQHPPEAISEIIGLLNQGFELVYASASNRYRSVIKNFLAKEVKGLLARISGNPAISTISSYRGISINLIKSSSASFSLIESKLSLDALLHRRTNNIKSFSLEMRQRDSGRTNYSWNQLIKYGLILLVNFRMIPVRLITVLFLCYSFVLLMMGAFYYFHAYLSLDKFIPANTIRNLFLLVSLVIAVLFSSFAFALLNYRSDRRVNPEHTHFREHKGS